MTFSERNSRDMWNIIRSAKRQKQSEDVISLAELEKYFGDKFCSSEKDSEFIATARHIVQTSANSLCDTAIHGFENINISEHQIRRYIKKLKPNTGCDGITPEHLKNSIDSKLLVHLSRLFTVCVKFGVLPDKFNHSVLVPIIKKSTLDPTSASSYRPITISVTLSKILELHILESCMDFSFSKAQFGFIPGRGTGVATALANDVGAHCISEGSPVFYASLDAEGAFDALSHHVILYKTKGVVPDPLWLLLYRSYSNMTVQIKWNKNLSEDIPVTCGTKQGGLASPFIFNMFYYDLVQLLQETNCGVRIGNSNYNCLCCADDILLCSTTVSGLQKLMSTASKCIKNYGLRFNPDKTTCMIMGRNPFTTTPVWLIEDSPIKIENNIKYLGTDLATSQVLSTVKVV